MQEEYTFSLGMAVVLFTGSALVIAVAGTRLSSVCDHLADRTGLGEAVVGAVLLGAATSLAGITASVTAAIDGLPALSLSNAIGGIAAQTAFLGVADLLYRKANLEHAAASLENNMQAALLVILLSLMLVGMFGPDLVIWGVHPLSPALVMAYLLGQRMIFRARRDPMWRPTLTRHTRLDLPSQSKLETEKGSTGGPGRLWVTFLVVAVVVMAAGVLATRTAVSIAGHTGLNQSVVGALFTAVATSLPELITSVAAVRRGALTLAVSAIVGGNAFDTLFAAVADVFYRNGSIYHSATNDETLLIAVSCLMTAVLMLGLLSRQRRGIGRIGFESFFVLMIYLGGLAFLTIANG